jgi:hypothetical protein
MSKVTLITTAEVIQKNYDVFVKTALTEYMTKQCTKIGDLNEEMAEEKENHDLTMRKVVMDRDCGKRELKAKENRIASLNAEIKKLKSKKRASK